MGWLRSGGNFHKYIGLLLLGFLIIIGMTPSVFAFDWQESTGPEGGSVWALAATSGGDIYAGLWREGGVFRSVDQGVTWVEVGLKGTNITDIIITDDGTIFASSSNGYVYRSQDQGGTWPVSGSSLTSSEGALAYDAALEIIYAGRWNVVSRSTNGGDSWEQVSTNFPDVGVAALAAIGNGGPLYAGTDGSGVYRSVDGGATWDAFNTGMDAYAVYNFLVVPEGDIYAAGFCTGISRTEWSGTSWTPLNQGLTDLCCKAVCRDAAGRLYAGTLDSAVFVSDDGGLNWVPVNSDLGQREILCLLPLGPGEVLAGCYGGGVHRTADAGGTWNPSSQGINRTNVTALCLTGAGTLYTATFGDGVFRSLDDGNTWTPLNNGIEDYDLFDLIIHPDSDFFAATWLGHVYRSQDSGATWNRADTGLTLSRVSCLAAKSNGDLFAGGWHAGGIWRSTNMGDTWSPANTGITEEDLTSIFVEGNGNLLISSIGGGVFRSENDGGSWTALNNGLTDLSVNQVLAAPGGVLFAATGGGGGLFRSLDNGGLWERVDASMDEGSIAAVVVNSLGHIFAGSTSNSKVFRSTDGGDSWHIVSAGFPPNVQISCFGFDQQERLLVGTRGLAVVHTLQSTPVFLSSFAAERSAANRVEIRWVLQETGDGCYFDVYRDTGDHARLKLTRAPLTGGPSFTYLDEFPPAEECRYWLHLVFAQGGESWFGPVSVAAAHGLLLGLRLDSVGPNPVDLSATIQFTLPTSGAVDLCVYDLRGRCVRRLKQDVAMSGTQEIVWDVRDHAGGRVGAGTYLLRLQSGNVVITRKVLVLASER